MNIAHIMLQAKGGAGKTTCCVQLSQYLIDKTISEIDTERERTGKKNKFSEKLRIYDTDPSNQSLARFSSLGVEVLDILDAENEIDKSKFDPIFSAFLEGNHDILMDTGSSNFHAFVNYMRINDIVEATLEYGKQIIMHVPINHDSSYLDTCQSLDMICKNFPQANIVIWSNAHTVKKEKIRDFTETEAYRENKNIIGVVEIRYMDNDTEFEDFSEMLKDGLTYSEVQESKEFSMLQKRRLKKIGKEIMKNIHQVLHNQVQVSNQEV